MIFRKMKVSEIDIVRKIYFESFETKVVGNLEYTADNIYVVVNDDNIVGNCVEKVNTELKNLSESREIEKMWNQF